MKRLLLILMLLSPGVQAMGLEMLACGAIICLAGGEDESACAPYLDYYYSIDGPTKEATKRMRKAFLKMCNMQEAPPSPEFNLETP